MCWSSWSVLFFFLLIAARRQEDEQKWQLGANEKIKSIKSWKVFTVSRSETDTCDRDVPPLAGKAVILKLRWLGNMQQCELLRRHFTSIRIFLLWKWCWILMFRIWIPVWCEQLYGWLTKEGEWRWDSGREYKEKRKNTGALEEEYWNLIEWIILLYVYIYMKVIYMKPANNMGHRVSSGYHLSLNVASSTRMGLHLIELSAKGVPWKSSNNPC